MLSDSLSFALVLQVRCPGEHKELPGLRIEYPLLAELDLVHVQGRLLGKQTSVEGVSGEEGVAKLAILKPAVLVFVIPLQEELDVLTVGKDIEYFQPVFDLT